MMKRNAINRDREPRTEMQCSQRSLLSRLGFRNTFKIQDHSIVKYKARLHSIVVNYSLYEMKTPSGCVLF